MPLDPVIYVGVMLLVAGFTYLIGRERSKWPGEEEMIRRIVALRTRRKIETATRVDVEREVEEKSDRLVSSAAGEATRT
jgi:hypothetical protein